MKIIFLIACLYAAQSAADLFRMPFLDEIAEWVEKKMVNTNIPK
jgi:hypothetical protein